METNSSKPVLATETIDSVISGVLRKRVLASALALALAGIPTIGSAGHSWGSYHWARTITATTTEFTLKLSDNLSRLWLIDPVANKPYLITTQSDWSASTVLNTTIVKVVTDPKRCVPTAGMVQVCNYSYGKRGWLGIAQIWAKENHITQGAVKLNDSYFNTATYNTSAWRNMVMCQEVGHTLGLDHQDENFSPPNLGTCMDYTNDPSTNQHPDKHDYDQLVTIYSHGDTSTTVASSINGATMPREMREGDFNERTQWGALVRSSKNGLKEIYRREFGGGYQLITFVTWAAGEGRGRH